jgi:hypothetical protein
MSRIINTSEFWLWQTYNELRSKGKMADNLTTDTDDVFTPEVVSDLINRYYNISIEIQTQYDLIFCKFNVKPTYVLLGTVTENFINAYALSQVENSAHTFVSSGNLVEAILQAYYGLTPIVSQDLPKDFIQVVVPPEAYS